MNPPQQYRPYLLKTLVLVEIPGNILTGEPEPSEEHNYSAQSNYVEVIENGLNLLPETSIETSTSNSPKPSKVLNNNSLLKASVVAPASSNTPKVSRVLGPIRPRKRKADVQRQGLAYGNKQNENKRKELELEDRRLKSEERKIAVMGRQVTITKLETNKKHDSEEKRIKLEADQRKYLIKIIERQEKLIEFIFSKDVQC